MHKILLWLDYFLPIFQSNLGAIFFIPFYAVWVTCLLPGIWATMLAGAIYGTFLGTILVFIGASFGAVLSFWLGRTIFRNWVEESLESLPRLQLFLKTISAEGLRLVLMTRLSPVFPFSFLNFAYGFSKVTFRDYVIGLIGILPGTILFCALGELAGEAARFGNVLSSERANAFSWLNIIGLFATILVILILSRVIRKTFQNSDPL
tara:strand:+ start:88 stop:705 length:618 start_codon:yes stop_codon:yes gene_type:complete